MSELLYTILLVDRCEQERETYRRYLLQDRQNTYKILAVGTGKQAVELCSEQFPDAIVLDDLLPDLDGLEVLNQLKALIDKDDLPVIVLTGQGNEEIAVPGMNSGATDYLVKSNTTPENLRLAIHQVLERMRLKQQLEESQAALRQACDDLERRVQRTTELEQANQKMQVTLEELQVAEAEVRSSNEELANARKAVELERQRYQDLFEQAPDGYLVTDIWGNIQTANRAAAALLRVKKNYLVGKPLINYIAALERQVFQTQLAQLQQVQDWEVYLQPRKGTAFPVTIAATSMHDSLGQLLGWRWLLHDITDRKQMEQSLQAAQDNLERLVAERTAELSQANAQLQQEIRERKLAEASLRESEARYRTIAELTSDYIYSCLITPEGTAVEEWATPNISRITGYTHEEFLDGTRTWFDIIYHDDLPTVRQFFHVLLQQKDSGTLEYRIATKHGEIRWIRDRIQPEWDEIEKRVVRILGAAEDISDCKQAQQKVQEQAALLNLASDAIFVRDLEHHILFWNQSAECLYGWSALEALGEKATDLFSEEVVAQVEAALNTAIEQGEWQGELQHVTKEGKHLIVQSRWTLVRDEAGHPKSILAVNTDITQKKQLEQQFLRLQRLENLGTLASGIAHDLNNIIQPILITAQLLKLKFSNTDERDRQLLAMLETSAKRGADLVKQILTFARGAEGKRSILPVSYLLRDIEQLIKQTFPKSIEIKTDIPPDLWTACVDATQLHQVLMNLCVNARDAMPDGGTLSLSATNLCVDETYTKMNIEAKVGSYIVVTVADTGCGIPPEIIDRIFDPFFTTKELGQGTGLGLLTVLGIIKNHGGFVQVESQVGLGTQFRVYLPTGVCNVEPQSPQLELLAGQGELILIVDDEVAVQKIIQTSLEQYNYRTLIASNGIEAIALYAQHKQEIGVVLIDMMMPSMDGLTAIRALQRMNPSVKIIATSGLASNRQLVEAAGISVRAFLSKPYTLKELLDILSHILGTP